MTSVRAFFHRLREQRARNAAYEQAARRAVDAEYAQALASGLDFEELHFALPSHVEMAAINDNALTER
jgi:hypothetical protein